MLAIQGMGDLVDRRLLVKFVDLGQFVIRDAKTVRKSCAWVIQNSVWSYENTSQGRMRESRSGVLGEPRDVAAVLVAIRSFLIC